MEEVSPDQSKAQRSQTTGKLLITMPKTKQVLRSAKSAVPSSLVTGATQHKSTRGAGSKQDELEEKGRSSSSVTKATTGTLLEVNPSLKSKTAELANIVKTDNTIRAANSKREKQHLNEEEPSPSSDFVDDPDVPPLM